MSDSNQRSSHQPSKAPSKVPSRLYDERVDYEPKVQKSFAPQTTGAPTIREPLNTYHGPAPSAHGKSDWAPSDGAPTIPGRSKYGPPEGVATSNYGSNAPSNRGVSKLYSTELYRDSPSAAGGGTTTVPASSASRSFSRDRYAPDKSGKSTKAFLGTKLQRDGPLPNNTSSKPAGALKHRGGFGQTESGRSSNYRVAPDMYASSEAPARYVSSRAPSGRAPSLYSPSITPALIETPPSIPSFMTSKHDIVMSARQLDRELMEGEDAKMQDEWALEKFKEMPLCPDNNPWMKRPEGYQCQMKMNGKLVPGGHAVTDTLIEEGRGGIFSVQGHFSTGFLWSHEGGKLLGPYYKDNSAVTEEEKKQWYKKADLEKLAAKREKIRLEKIAEQADSEMEED